MSEVLEVLASADRSSPDSDDQSWIASIELPEQLAGVFAYGATFAEARKALAEMVWLTLNSPNQTNTDPSRISAVRIIAMTWKTFPVATLTPSGPSPGAG